MTESSSSGSAWIMPRSAMKPGVVRIGVGRLSVLDGMRTICLAVLAIANIPDHATRME
jgi:hypothetical protein